MDMELNLQTAVKRYQAADLFSSMTLWVLDAVQNIVVQMGLLCGCLLCAHRIMVDGTMTVGDFVLYLSYITQLYGPLNWFGVSPYKLILVRFLLAHARFYSQNYYRVIQVLYFIKNSLSRISET
jgi:ABC-type transport system involved in Fe-S cluster assembly fused permease/ATPase subunit